MSAIEKIGDDRFVQEVEMSDRLTVVEFGAEWCIPCKKLHPILEDVYKTYGDRVKIVEVDVEHARETAVKYGITGVPQLLFFNQGKVKETVVGLLTRVKIEEKIEKYL